MRVSASPERSSAPALRRKPGFLRVLARVWRVALGVLVLGAGSRSAFAQAAPPISVDREPGAEDCPDTAALVTRVETIIGRGGSSDATPYRVTFSRSPQGFTAAIRSGSDGATVRYLDAHEANCAALAHATAIALAVLFDADLGATTERAEDMPPEAPTPTTPPVQAPPLKAPQTERGKESGSEADIASQGQGARARVEPLLSLGAAALVGVLRPVVLALVADAGVEIENFRGSLGAVWVTPQTIELAPGSARENLISGNVRLCYALASRGTLRFDLCSGALVGAATAEARGFTSNERHTELFLAFPAELTLSGRSRFIGWQVSPSALVLYRPNEFEVEGRGPTYRPAPVAGMFALRVFFEPLR
jgi:hypothetical protein